MALEIPDACDFCGNPLALRANGSVCIEVLCPQFWLARTL